MSYFMIDKDHHVIMGVSDTRFDSCTHYFVAATTQQVAKFHALAATLPDDFYVELADVMNTKPAAPANNKKTAPTKPRTATPQTQKAIADMLKARNKEKK